MTTSTFDPRIPSYRFSNATEDAFGRAGSDFTDWFKSMDRNFRQYTRYRLLKDPDLWDTIVAKGGINSSTLEKFLSGDTKTGERVCSTNFLHVSQIAWGLGFTDFLDFAVDAFIVGDQIRAQSLVAAVESMDRDQVLTLLAESGNKLFDYVSVAEERDEAQLDLDLRPITMVNEVTATTR